MRTIFCSALSYGDFSLRHRLSGFHEDLNMIAIIGTSDRPYWLAEACESLLLFLLCHMLLYINYLLLLCSAYAMHAFLLILCANHLADRYVCIVTCCFTVVGEGQEGDAGPCTCSICAQGPERRPLQTPSSGQGKGFVERP